MSDLNVPSGPCSGLTDESRSIEAKLRHLFAEQLRLRELLERTREELDRVNQEVLRTQDDFCTDANREEEYLCILERVLGYNPRIDPKELEEALAGGQSLERFIAELETEAGQPSTRQAG